MELGDIVTTYFPYQNEVTGVIIRFRRYRGKEDSYEIKMWNCGCHTIRRHVSDVKKIGTMSIEQLLTHEDLVLRELGLTLQQTKDKSC